MNPFFGETSERPRFSVTGLMTYEACPYQFYTNFIEGKPPPVTPAMRRGANIHVRIARHFRQPALLEVEAHPNLDQLFNTFLNSRFNVPAVDVEQPFVLPFAGGDVHGRIDVVLPGTEGGLELVDFKSGLARDRDELARSLQLPIYALAAGRRHEVPDNRLSYTYFFLRDGQEVHFEPGTVGFEAITDRVEGILEAIHEGLFDPTPGCKCYACRGDFGRTRTRARSQ